MTDTPTLGYRRSFATLIPDFNTAVQPEFAAMLPPGVTQRTASFAIDAQVLDNVEAAARSLLTCKPDAFLVGLATDSFPGGVALLDQGIQRLRALTQAPVLSATHAVYAALRHLGARELSLVTPFDAAANSHVETAFADAGFRVVACQGLACEDLSAISSIPASEIRGAFVRAAGTSCDALVQIGTGLRVAGLITGLEQELGATIVASNPALCWQALRDTGIDDAVAGHGRLLAGA